MREAVAKPAPRPPGTQARARGQRAERSRPGAVLGPWGDCSTCPPVPRFVVRSGSWASPWGPGPVPRPPSHHGSGAPGQSCRVSHPATTDPSQTPQETQSRTGPVHPPGPQPSHALPTARGQQGCRLTGSRLGRHHHGLEASQHSGPVSESGPGKTTPERDRPALHAPTAEPPGLPWVGTFLQAMPFTEAP